MWSHQITIVELREREVFIIKNREPECECDSISPQMAIDSMSYTQNTSDSTCLHLLAVDPGAAAGWALFDIDSKQLLACGLNGTPETHVNIGRAVIERPHSGRGKATVRDLVTLALRAGEWAGRIMAVTGVQPVYVEPSTWKGSTPKDISERRTRAKLEPSEGQVLEAGCQKVAASKQNNVIDAVGLGLWVLGRR